MRGILLGLFGLPALALTVVRLWQPTTEWGLVAVAVSPAAIVVYALGLLLSCLRLGFSKRARWGLPALVCLAGVLVHAHWLAPAFTGANPPPASGAGAWRILTVNLHVGGADTAQVVQEVSDRHVDVLVVEEVTPAAETALQAAGLDALLPTHAGASASGPGGTMVFTRFPVTATTRLGTTLGSWRVSLGSPTPVVVDAVHVSPPTEPGPWRADLAALAGERPTFMVGDFNATADHAAFGDLARRLPDAAQLANSGWQPTWPARFPVFTIDHVLVAPQWAVVSTRSVDIDGTDHLGLLATVAQK